MCDVAVVLETARHHALMFWRGAVATWRALGERFLELVVLPVLVFLVAPYVATLIHSARVGGTVSQHLVDDTQTNLIVSAIVIVLYAVLLLVWHWLRAPVLQVAELSRQVSELKSQAGATHSQAGSPLTFNVNVPKETSITELHIHLGEYAGIPRFEGAIEQSAPEEPGHSAEGKSGHQLEEKG